MNLHLQSLLINHNSTIQISGSKSESNRLLLLQTLYPNITLENVSNSDDTKVMLNALQSNEAIIDVHHAGTTMRSLTAFFAVQEGREVILTGSPRMKERPIKILVEALKQLGAEIYYEEKQGFPPLRIKGKKITQNKVSLPANVSSQYISALLLIAPKLENGLELTLEGDITSMPYIKMTLALLNEMGIETSFIENKITVNSQFSIHNFRFVIESDWSSASYFYSIIALSELGTQISLSSYKKSSLQGDTVLVGIYEKFGVETTFEGNNIRLKKIAHCHLATFSCQLNATPDIAQTMAVTCFGLGIGCHLTGLHTLKIKETDRLEALKNEFTKLGATIAITEDSLTLNSAQDIKKNISIKTYQDHRMAMAFAPLALKVPVIIEDAEVVSKSFPDFWENLKSIGFKIEEK